MKHARTPLAVVAAIAAAGPAMAADDYVIGVATAQTGFLAPYDQPALTGLQFAVDEINAKGGLLGQHKIVLEIKDTRSDVAATVQAAQELVGAGVKMLITPCDADPSIAAGQISQEAQIPTFSFCGSTPTMTEAVGDYMFGAVVSDDGLGLVLAQYALEQGHRSALLLLSPDSAYTMSMPRYFASAFRAGGGTVAGETSFAMGQQDFSAQVTEIKALDPQPDVIVTSAYEPDFPAFIKQLRSVGVTIPIIGSDAIDTPTTAGLGSLVDGVVHATGGFASEGSPLAAFYERYGKATGTPADTLIVAYGYDLGLIIEAAVTAAGSTDGPAVRDAVAALENVPGVTGPITYAGTNRMPVHVVGVVELQGGKQILRKLASPAVADLPGLD